MTVTVRVRAGDLPAECSLELRIDGELRSRQRVTPLGPDTELEVPVVLPGLAEGTHAVTIDLEPADALACDNRRFAAVAVRDAPTILVVGPANGAEEVASMVAAMIAPADPAAGVSQHRVQRRPDDELAHGDLRRVLALFLADTGPLPEDARAAVARYVEAGGALVMIPGPNTAPALFESLGSLMPADVESIGDCRDSVTMAATDFSHPYLASFSDPGVDSINSRRVFRRLELGALHKDARLIAAFSDGRPALIAAPVGRGQAVLLAFSPARAWGQFGTQAAPMIVLLQTILEHLSPPPEDVGSYTAGQRVSIALAGAADGLRAVSDADGTARLLSLSGATAQIPTDSAGNFRVPADDEPAVTLRRYSVNVSERESAAGRLDPSAIQEALAPAEVIVTADPLGLGKPWNTAHQGRELLVPQSLALLALLFVESLFANRFYRRQPDRVTSP